MRELVERNWVDGHMRSRQPSGRQGRGVTVNLSESPLSWLRARGHVDARQFEAGERLRGDYERAALGPHVTMRWDAAPPGRTPRGIPQAPDRVLAQLSAKQRFDGAMTEAGPGLADILWRVVCAGEGMAHAEKDLGWPARAGKLVLRLALDRVAGFYAIR